MKKLIPLAIAAFLFSSAAPTQSRARMFEVRVEARINNCISRHDVVVEARHQADAREKARRVVQAKLTTKATRVKEIKRP